MAVVKLHTLNETCSGFGLTLVRQVHWASIESPPMAMASGRLRLTIPMITKSASTEAVPVTPGSLTFRVDAIRAVARNVSNRSGSWDCQFKIAHATTAMPRAMLAATWKEAN